MKQQYRPEIDGLRAIAVLAVVFYHAGELIPGGYVGVDVFFVISGFLITKAIQSQIDDGSFSIVEFWERRIRRLMPALIVMSATTLAIGYLILTPWELEELGRSSLAQIALLANVYFWRQSGYFQEAAETKPLLHTWSLAVEEQFYLVLPPALMLLALWSRRRTPIILGAVAIGSFALSVYGTQNHPAANFFLLPTRAWELFAGSLLAYLPPPPRERSQLSSAQALAGLIAILLPMALYDRHTAFPGVAALPSVLGTAAVIHATNSPAQTWIKSLLSLRCLTGVGLISYSLYLWHWPLLVFAGLRFPEHTQVASSIAAGASFVLAAASWKFVETPVRRRVLLANRRAMAFVALVSSVLIGMAGFAVARLAGVPSRFETDLHEATRNHEWRGLRDGIEVGGEPAFISLGAARASGAQPEERLDFLLWGDSHAIAYAPILNAIAFNEGMSGAAFIKETHLPLPGLWTPSEGPKGTQLRRRDRVINFIRSARPLRLILIARWTAYIEGPSDVEIRQGRHPHANWHLSREGTIPSKEGSARGILAGLTELLSICEETQTRLVVLRQVPETGLESPSKAAIDFAVGRRSQLPIAGMTATGFGQRRATFTEILQASELEELLVLDPAPSLYQADDRVRVFSQGVSLYRDDDHLSFAGARFISGHLQDALQRP